MATPAKRSGSDLATVAVPFSYAQAAKGLSSSSTSAGAPSKPASGTITPSKDSAPAPPSISTVPSGMSWADDTEEGSAPTEKESHRASSIREPQTNGIGLAAKHNLSPQQKPESTVSSPDFGTSSASTLVKDDDVSSLPNASSESTWENKSQTSNTVDKAADSNDNSSEKSKSKDTEQPPQKSLQEAPIPMVNIWKQRADQAAKAKAALPSPAKSAVVSSQPTTNGIHPGHHDKPNGAPRPEFKKKGKTPYGGDDGDVAMGAPREKRQNGDLSGRPRDDDRPTQGRRDVRLDIDTDKSKKSARARAIEKDSKVTPPNVPPPPVRDQESWPTPDSALDEGKKKSQDKNVKIEKERNQSSASKPHGKQEWVPVPYTPSVVFTTALPNTSSSSRRGGRGGGRGNAQGGGRGPNGVNGTGVVDRDASAPTSLPNGDQSRRGRPDGAAQESSPSKAQRTGSAGSPPWRDKSVPVADNKITKSPSAADADMAARRPSMVDDTTANQQPLGQNNSHSRPYQTNRPKQARKFDGPAPADKRKESDIMSPTKDSTSNSFGRQTSLVAQPEEDGEKRPTNNEGQGSQNKAPTGDRRASQFNSFSGRERPDRGRGGMRGGRGGSHSYQSPHHPNNHHFTNGHAPPLQNSATFPLARSPTTFHPEQQNYFVPMAQQYRNSRANGPRSQSVTSDSFYGRMPSGYPGGPQPLAPIQTYMGQMYDPPMMYPMTAMPFSPYGDQNALLSMVSMQLEYYFSVDNLCKDMFLRKHMDSKGFVFLSVIANFNRMKNLTTDLESIRLVAYHSRTIDFRIGVDGKDRLRRREGWEQFILNMPERDPTAQHDGPTELHNPPVPHPQGFDPFAPRYASIPVGSPTSPGPLSADGVFQPLNGIHSGAPVNPIVAENGMNGITLDVLPVAAEVLNGDEALPPYQGTGSINPIVNGDEDSFSDEQVEALSVIVRKQETGQSSAPPAASRTFSNGSVDSRSGVPDETPKSDKGQSGLRVNGTSSSQGGDSIKQDEIKRSFSPFSRSKTPTLNPVRLFWVKDKDTPVESLPVDATYEFYTHLRSKALEQRNNAPAGNCPYDMDVLYQFWSHFLIRNFNTRMYDEFRRIALEDVEQNLSDVGMRNLIKYYGESLSSQTTIRGHIARHYVDLVKSNNTDVRRPALKQLRSAWRNGALNLKSRKKISDFIDDDLRNLLEN